MRPGVDVITTDQPPPRSQLASTGIWFVVGQTEIGPAATAVEIRSLSSYTTTFGARSGGTLLYDAIEAYFREGGGVAWVSAIPTTPSAVGLRAVDRGNRPDPARATRKEPDKGEGKQAEAGPLVILPADYEAALDVFTKALGPGQVSVPGITDPAVQQALLDHAEANNRVALIDGGELADATAQEAMADTLRSLPNGRYGAIFGPWAVIPGVTAGTDRHVPFSAIEAGIISRNDQAVGNPSLAAAGPQGRSLFATGLTMTYTDQEYSDLNEGSFDSAKLVYGEVQAYGYRALVDPATPDGALWLSFGHARLAMGIAQLADAIGQRYVFTQIDGKGLTIGQFGGELRAMLMPFFTAGALFGETPADAYDVDVGAQVNTPETIANGELHAVIRVRMSPFAEWVVINIVKVATTESVATAA